MVLLLSHLMKSAAALLVALATRLPERAALQFLVVFPQHMAAQVHA